MHMGDVNVEILGDDTMKKRMDEEFLLVEGLDDTMMSVQRVGIKGIMVCAVEMLILTSGLVGMIMQRNFIT